MNLDAHFSHSNRDKRDMKEFIKVDDDGQLVMGKGVGGLGDFHCDLKSLLDTVNIMKASADFFAQKISSKVEEKMGSIGSENSKN